MKSKIAMFAASIACVFALGSNLQASTRSAVGGTTLSGYADCGLAQAFPWKTSFQWEGRQCPVTIKFVSRDYSFEYTVDGDMVYRGTYQDNRDKVYLQFYGAEYSGSRLFHVISFGHIIDATRNLNLVGTYTPR